MLTANSRAAMFDPISPSSSADTVDSIETAGVARQVSIDHSAVLNSFTPVAKLTVEF